MIRRETDAALINKLSNLAGVREHVCYHSDKMDWSAAFPSRQTGIVVLTDGDQACAVFAMTADRAWQVHTVFGPECRGRKAIEAAKQMIEYMRPYADIIWGATPIANPKARWFNRQLGAKVIGHDQYEAEGDVEIFELRLNTETGIGIPEQDKPLLRMKA